jgi:uncharacterized damage-inducible protein DinB
LGGRKALESLVNLVEYAKTMAAYSSWMNGRLFEHCATLTEQQRKRDLGAFFKSIHGTLNHLLLADRIWMGRFTKRPFQVRSLDQELFSDFDELRNERQKTDQEMTVWAHSLRAPDFAQQLSYTSIVNPQPRTLPFWLAVVHFFNHQTHHRGQVTTLLKQSGQDPGVTDLLWLPTLQQAK